MKIVQHPTQPWCRWECNCGRVGGAWLMDRAAVERNAALHAASHK